MQNRLQNFIVFLTMPIIGKSTYYVNRKTPNQVLVNFSNTYEEGRRARRFISQLFCAI